jgi:hypothetical protein
MDSQKKLARETKGIFVFLIRAFLLLVLLLILTEIIQPVNDHRRLKLG